MPCVSCGKAGTNRCTGCNLLTYCSIKCQKLDWIARHATQCPQLGLPFAELAGVVDIIPYLNSLTDQHLWYYLRAAGRIDESGEFSWLNMKEEMKTYLSKDDFRKFWWTRCHSSNAIGTPPLSTKLNFFRAWIFFYMGNRVLQTFISNLGVHFDIDTHLTVMVFLDYRNPDSQAWGRQAGISDGEGRRLLIPVLEKLQLQIGANEEVVAQAIDYLHKRNPNRPEVRVNLRGGALLDEFEEESILSLKFEERADVVHPPINNPTQEVLRQDGVLGIADPRIREYTTNLLPASATTPETRKRFEFVAALAVLQIALQYRDSSVEFYAGHGKYMEKTTWRTAGMRALELYTAGVSP
jgi:hypothetical protein